MRALYGRKGFDIKIADIPLKPMDYNEVIVKVRACGVCGTDIHYLTDAQDYSPLGHEIYGEIVEVGKSVKHINPNDRVVVEDIAFCGICSTCKDGNVSLCKKGHDLNGQSGMSEYLCIHSSMIHVVDDLDIEACLTEPLAVAINAFLTAGIPAYGTLVIAGMGPIALLCANIAKLFGTGRIVMLGRNCNSVKDIHRVQVARKMGVDEIFFTDDAYCIENARECCLGGADGVVLTTPPETLPDVLNVLKYGGTAVPIGIDLGGRQKAVLDINWLIFNKIKLIPFLGEPAIHFPLSIKMLQSRKILTQDIITHTFGFMNADEILKKTRDKQQAMIKPVFLN